MEGWPGGPDDDIPLVTHGEIQVVELFALDDGEEDGVVRSRGAVRVGTGAQDQPERVSRLMPRAGVLLSAAGVVELDVGQTGGFVRVRQVGGRQAASEQFGEGATGCTDLVVHVRFVVRKEEKPILLHGRTGFRWVACDFRESRVGHQWS